MASLHSLPGLILRRGASERARNRRAVADAKAAARLSAAKPTAEDVRRHEEALAAGRVKVIPVPKA